MPRLLPNTGCEGALILAGRLRSAIEATLRQKRVVTASLGIASLGPDIADGTALVAAADRALYYSKESGRNRVSHARELTTTP